MKNAAPRPGQELANIWRPCQCRQPVERELIANYVSRAKRAKVIDEHAAIFILQGALDRLAALLRSPDIR